MDMPSLAGAILASGTQPFTQAEMVAPEIDKGQGTAGTFVQSSWQMEVLPPTATLRISALGLYRAFINGKRVGEDLLTPGWTCYDDRIAYQTYEVSQLLQVGENRIEI